MLRHSHSRPSTKRHRYRPTHRLLFEPLEDRRLLASVVYGDALQSGWADWSWSTTRDLSSTDPVYAGANAISAQHDAAWAGLYLRSNSATNLQPHEEIRFYVHGGTTGGQNVAFKVVLSDETAITEANISPVANAWSEVIIEYQGRRENLSVLSEADITAALQRIAQSDEAHIVFLRGHGERDISDEGQSGYSNLAALLVQKGLKVSSQSLAAQTLPQ